MSYENGCIYCYPRWDRWFKYWSIYMVVAADYGNGVIHNYTLPIATAVGNHESGNFQRPSRKDNGYYIRLFPHELEAVPNQFIVPDPQETRALQYIHYISNHTVMLVLDSWVHATHLHLKSILLWDFSQI